MIRRVQLGTSRLEALEPNALEVFLDESWMHLGDPERGEDSATGVSVSRLAGIFKRHSASYVLKEGFRRLLGTGRGHARRNLKSGEIYNRTNFREFYYQKGDSLPVGDDSVDFVFSEHFFEHLFFDEALALMKECYRILKQCGVLRTCVPDADLRTYEPPEPLGYPDAKLPYSDPSKHKTRWSVYSLTEAIRLAGFEAMPLRYCDKSGEYVTVDPSESRSVYRDCLDEDMVFDMRYIMRTDSLIVDGIKRPAE